MKLRARPITLALACSTTLLLGACGGNDTAGNDAGKSATPAEAPAVATEPAAPVAPAASGGDLASFIGDNICDALPVSALQEAFGAPADVQVQPSHTGRTDSCNYSWPRPDAEERKQAMLQEMMKNATRPPGERIKLDLHKLSTDYNVSVMLRETKATASSFVPPKLTEEQLQERIKAATEAANKRLTDKQRELVGKDGTESIAGGMIRKTNERTEIDGVGSATYWIPIMGGSLNVLDGNVHVSITPMLADDEQGNIEAAKKVFTLLKR